MAEAARVLDDVGHKAEPHDHEGRYHHYSVKEVTFPTASIPVPHDDLHWVKTAQTKSPEAFKRSGLPLAAGSNYIPGPPLEPIVSTDTLDSAPPTQDATMPIADIERPTPTAAKNIRDDVG